MTHPHEATYGDLPLASDATVTERVAFIRRTYAHLGGAVLGLLLFEVVLFGTGAAESLTRLMFGGQWSWLIALGAFMVVSMIAQKWAATGVSVATQYMGLGLYVVAQSVILAPLLYFANEAFPGHEIIGNAAVITALLFSAMTGVVFLTKKDFSFLRSTLMVCCFGAMGLMVCSMIFGFSLGLVFTVFMIVVMCGYILYDTSNVMRHYRVDSHVAASLALFASLATLFWYVIQLLMYLAGSRD